MSVTILNMYHAYKAYKQHENRWKHNWMCTYFCSLSSETHQVVAQWQWGLLRPYMYFNNHEQCTKLCLYELMALLEVDCEPLGNPWALLHCVSQEGFLLNDRPRETQWWDHVWHANGGSVVTVTLCLQNMETRTTMTCKYALSRLLLEMD